MNSTVHANIPQNLERLYIVAFKDEKQYHNFKFPEPIILTKTINDILEEEVDEKYFYEKYEKIYQILKNDIINNETFYQLRRKYVRENKNNLCPTLIADMGMGGHNVPLVLDKVNNRIRKLTPIECARLQGFPDDYLFPKELSDSAIYKQIGNSVTVPLVSRVVENIKRVINDEN